MMTENDYIAEYIREKRPEIITSFDYVGWKMCRIMKDALRGFTDTFCKQNDEEVGEQDAE